MGHTSGLSQAKLESFLAQFRDGASGGYSRESTNSVMASFAQHTQDCRRFLGADFAEVNRWIDQYFETYGPSHRKFLHHREGVEQAREIFGDSGAIAAAIHILRDCRHIPSKQDYDLGYVDALGLKKHWSTAAYIKYSDQEFESVVMQMLKPSAVLLWASSMRTE